MLSQIENGQVNPSINTLRSIADVLETPLYKFFQEKKKHAVIVHPEKRLTIGLKNEPDVNYELLTPDVKGKIEFCMMIIPPQKYSYRSIEGHEGEEVAFMYAGKEVILEIENVQYKMKAGNSVRIPPKARHAWHNKSDVEVQVIFAITPLSF